MEAKEVIPRIDFQHEKLLSMTKKEKQEMKEIKWKNFPCKL
jgi:hypothetical protein